MKKVKNLLKKKKWKTLILTVVTMVTLFSACAGDSTENKNDVEKDKTEVVSLDEVGGFEQWQQDGFKQKVRTQIAIIMPDTTSDTMCTAIIGDREDIDSDNIDNVNYVQIISPDGKEIQDWKWLMDVITNAGCNENGFFYFNATLAYKEMYEEVMPIFEVMDVEQFTGDNEVAETEEKETEEKETEKENNSDFIKVEHIEGTGPSFAELKDIETCIDYQSLGYETAEDFWFAVSYPSLFENDDSIPEESLEYVENNVDYKSKNFETAEDYWRFTVYETGDMGGSDDYEGNDE
ncbi:MAG: hypothetical protein PUB28_05535 [Roseburia sp.]|nr:hypothetical protein [Roseburia sp.]